MLTGRWGSVATRGWALVPKRDAGAAPAVRQLHGQIHALLCAQAAATSDALALLTTYTHALAAMPMLRPEAYSGACAATLTAIARLMRRLIRTGVQKDGRT